MSTSTSTITTKPIETIFQELHAPDVTTDPLPIREYIRRAISKYDIDAIQKILYHFPSTIHALDDTNKNLLLHDVFDLHFNIPKEMITSSDTSMSGNNNNNDYAYDSFNQLNLKSLVRISTEIVKLLVYYGIQYNVGGTSTSGTSIMSSNTIHTIGDASTVTSASTTGARTSVSILGTGGLLKANQEPIDFVNYKCQTPMDILLYKFELLLNYCVSETKKRKDNTDEKKSRLLSGESDRNNDNNNNHHHTGTSEVQPNDSIISHETILQQIMLSISECVQYCVDIMNESWKAQGCKDRLSILHSAVGVFPLLKIKTMKYLLNNFDHHGTSTIASTTASTSSSIHKNGHHDNYNRNTDYEYDDPHPHPLEVRDMMGRTVLMKSIYEATKRKQSWGDWKERFQILLQHEEEHNEKCIKLKSNSKSKSVSTLKQCWIRDDKGRLPIHVAIKNGLNWENGLKELITFDLDTLLEADPTTGLQPVFMIACGKDKTYDLKLMMKVLLTNPAVLQNIDSTPWRYV
jgi:hypothetical protein